MSKAATPFPYRGQWRIQVTLENGKRPASNFKKHADAVTWAAEQLATANSQHEPELGGPKQATLAQALELYAYRYSVSKGGVESEVNRINNYLTGAGLPMLKAVTNLKGGCELMAQEKKILPAAWEAHNERRREARSATNAHKHALANTRCAAIMTANIRDLQVKMQADGLSVSTTQKEIALIRAMFNSAIREWSWKGFENPCVGIKLGKSERRFVHLSTEQSQALEKALSKCDSPYFWPLVILAKETTLRLETLMQMTWDLVDVDNRVAMLPSKTGQQNYKFSLAVQEVLRGIPRDPSGRVFPMSKNAVKMAWNGVRIKAKVPDLQFKDLRHLGATDWARRGLGAHQLKQVLGHKNIQTAQFYIDLVGLDMEQALDQASVKGGVFQLPPVALASASQQLNQNRTERLRQAVSKCLELEVPPPSTGVRAEALPTDEVQTTFVSACDQVAAGLPLNLDESLGQAKPALSLAAPPSASVERESSSQSFDDMACRAADKQKQPSNILQFRPRQMA